MHLRLNDSQVWRAGITVTARLAAAGETGRAVAVGCRAVHLPSVDPVGTIAGG